MYIKRSIESEVLKLNKMFKVILVVGPRQVGKTTLLKNIKEKNRNYVTLDEMEIRSLAINDPKLFLQKFKAPLIIDEIQYAPQLLSYIKAEVDNKEERGLYWLTGSQQFELMNNVSESLAGRVGIIDMFSFSISEKRNTLKRTFNPDKINKPFTFDINQVFEEIFKGGMPDYYLNTIERDSFFSNYIRTYLERDIRSLAQVGDLNSFHKFLISVASRTGELLNYSSIAEDVGLSVNTIKKWISILESTGIIYLLQPYNNSELKRAIKNPKIYFLDTGLCTYLSKWNNLEALIDSSVSGHYLETFVISEIIKNIKSKKENIDIYYYRDKEKKEIDLVLYKENTLYPYEIKKTANPNKEMIKNFAVLNKTNKNIGPGGIICFYPMIIPLDEKNNVIPISSIL